MIYDLYFSAILLSFSLAALFAMAMADQKPSKRPRDDETLVEDCEDPKRQKSYNHILSLLDEEEEEPTQDLSSIITTFQQELSSDSTLDPPNAFSNSETDQEINHASASTTTAIFEGYASSSSGSSSPTYSNTAFLKEGDEHEDDGERVIRHLLEASDDELGIPHMEVNGFDVAEEDRFNNGLEGFSFGDGLWELEDEAANYYTLVQSELFM